MRPPRYSLVIAVVGPERSYIEWWPGAGLLHDKCFVFFFSLILLLRNVAHLR